MASPARSPPAQILESHAEPALPLHQQMATSPASQASGRPRLTLPTVGCQVPTLERMALMQMIDSSVSSLHLKATIMSMILTPFYMRAGSKHLRPVDTDSTSPVMTTPRSTSSRHHTTQKMLQPLHQSSPLLTASVTEPTGPDGALSSTRAYQEHLRRSQNGLILREESSTLCKAG